jgi:hypothetical protein
MTQLSAQSTTTWITIETWNRVSSDQVDTYIHKGPIVSTTEIEYTFHHALIIHCRRLSCQSLRSKNFNKSQSSFSYRCVAFTRYIFHFLISIYSSFAHLLMNAGSHAETIVPIGGYLCPSCSICGPHVHHCSEGTLVITPATCLPHPHQVVLSTVL